MEVNHSKENKNKQSFQKDKRRTDRRFTKEFDKITIETKPSLNCLPEKIKQTKRKTRAFRLSEEGTKSIAFDGKKYICRCG